MAESTWDALVLEHINSEDPESHLAHHVDRLVELLMPLQISEEDKVVYALVYIALAQGNSEGLDTVKDDVYSRFLVSYAQHVGVNEHNLTTYTLRMFHACLINDNKAIHEMMGHKSDVSYMDKFPGVLRDLVKRRVLADSTVKMDEVVKLYPTVLVRVLSGQLNYRDLAQLATSGDMTFRGVVEERAMRVAENYSEDNAERRMMDIVSHMPSFVSVATAPDLSVIQLLEEIAKIEGERFSLYFDQVDTLTSLFAAMNPASTNLFLSLVSYITSRDSYPTEGGVDASSLIFVPVESIPLDRQGKPLPIALSQPNQNGEVTVQAFRWNLVRAYSV